MSVLVHKNTKAIYQGIDNAQGALYLKQVIAYGTKIVAGVIPGKGATKYLGLPIFNTVQEAADLLELDATIIYTSASLCKDYIIEAADSGIKLIICIPCGVPVMDMISIKTYIKNSESILIGPNSPGVITPGECKLGIMPGRIYKPGKVGIVSRSAILSYEAAYQTTTIGFGQSTCIGIGGDPVIGCSFIDAIKLFQNDEQTEVIIMIGEIGGSEEEEAAAYICRYVTKPILSYIAGLTSPRDKRMGHAGAVVSSTKGGGASKKVLALESAGVNIIKLPSDIGKVLKEVIG